MFWITTASNAKPSQMQGFNDNWVIRHPIKDDMKMRNAAFLWLKFPDTRGGRHKPSQDLKKGV